MEVKNFENAAILKLFSIFVCELAMMCVCVRVHVCTQSLSSVQLFAIPWTLAHQPPLFMEFFQARILEWGAIFYSRGFSQPRNQTHVSYVSCIGK